MLPAGIRRHWCPPCPDRPHHQRPPPLVSSHTPGALASPLLHGQGPEGAGGVRLYSDEVFRVRIDFGEQYPLDPPDVIFLAPAPIHPHIYRCRGWAGVGWGG